MLGDNVEQLIAVVEFACSINHDQAITVAVECDADVCFMLDHSFLQILRFGRAVAVIDVLAVRFGADSDYVRAEFVEDVACDVVGGAVRAVHHDLHAAQVHVCREGALAEFDIAADRIFDTLGFAECLRCIGQHRVIQFGLDGGFDCIWQFLAAAGKELDAVVLERIVRSGDHHTRLQAQRARQVSHCRCRDRAGQIDVDASRDEPGFQR